MIYFVDEEKLSEDNTEKSAERITAGPSRYLSISSRSETLEQNTSSFTEKLTIPAIPGYTVHISFTKNLNSKN